MVYFIWKKKLLFVAVHKDDVQKKNHAEKIRVLD